MKKISLIVIGALLLTLFPTSAAAEQYWPEGPSIDSPHAIVIEVNSGTILYEKDSEVANYPASITKVMTILLALENCKLDEVVTFSRAAIDNTPRDSSHIWRDVGEKMTMEQCLYAVMLESANDCAYAVAEHVGTKLGGGYDTFIQLMNDRAKELGCTNTNFKNSSGLPDDEHVISAKDMGLIAAEAYRNETFRIITGTIKYQIPPTNKHDEITYLANHHRLLHRYYGTNDVYEYCTGGKTGYTSKAQFTLVSYAEKNGMALACVVMKTNNTAEWVDTKALFEYCFKNFKAVNMGEQLEALPDATENNGVMNMYGSYVSLDKSSYIVLPASASITDVDTTFSGGEGKGSQVATLHYSYAGRDVGEIDVVLTGNKVEESYFDKAQQEFDPEKKIVVIKPIYVVMLLAGLALLVFLIILCKKLFDNYYVILHNMEVRRQRKERFRPIEQKRKRNRRSDRMFR